MECKEKLGWIGGPLFCHSNGQRWTSSHFKSTYVYPLLHIQRNRGYPSLAPYDGAPDNSIEAKFYSFGMYRGGGPSQVTTRRAGCVRAASKAEIAEDGQWRTQNRDTSPCLNTTMRARWRTASTPHFFVCKVWIFRSFNGGVFLLFFYAFVF
jgi:hypothetical protein